MDMDMVTYPWSTVEPSVTHNSKAFVSLKMSLIKLHQ